MKIQPSFWDEIPDKKLSTGSRRDRCNKCQTAIWSLICQTGFTVKLDTTRLNVADQIEAYLKGVKMFDIYRVGMDGTFEAIFRTRLRMGSQKHIVLGWHQCTKDPKLDWPDYWAKPENYKTDGIPF